MIEDLYKSENFSLDESDNFTEDVEGNNKLRFKPINQYLLVVRIMLNAMNSEFSFMVNEIFNSFADPMEAFFDEDYLINGDHPLVTKQLLIKKQGGGVIGDDSFEFDNQILSHFGGTEASDLIKTANNSLLIKPEEIAEKELYFNTDTDKKLNQLKGIIDQSNFKEISKRLKLNFKTNSGICIRLEGPPGCGKTEFAMQIARVTGRPVYKIDLSEQQSMYFGQSERNIKKLFKQYKTFCLFSKVTPIMLWNESDAVFSKRIKVEKTIDQSSNAVQNIILDELDSFDGILIATTNMVDNFDPAFERRFLMKIQFDKPGIAVQQQIWKSKINDMEDELALNLATAYALSPAQIENVAKKVMFNELLNEPINKQVINVFCEEDINR
jgi:AAA+ superfamily predicted ATPase